MLYVATARAWYAAARARPVRRRARPALPGRPASAGARLDLDRSLVATRTTRATRSIQSLYSIGNGGFAGKGLGKGDFATTNGHTADPRS